jgi:hypothetical protein
MAKWPDGTTAINGTINYTNGTINVTASAFSYFYVNATGSTTFRTIDLGQQRVIPRRVQVREYPDNCRLADDLAVSGQLHTQDQNCGGGPYTVSGTIDYGNSGSDGTITGLTITPALTVGKQVQVSFWYSQFLPAVCGSGGGNPCTVTVDYDVNGWGVGTTLADENGNSAHTWLGDYFLAKAGNPGGITPTASTGAWTDLNAWLYNYTNALMTNSVDVMKAGLPNAIVTQGVGGHYGCARKGMAQAIAAHTLMGLQPVQAQLNLLPSWGLGDVPIIDSWEGIAAQVDSPGQSVPFDNLATNNYATQNLRGAAMGSLISSTINARGAGNPVYQFTGIKFWAYNDTDGYSPTTNSNYGLVTPSDNAYDGHEDVNASVTCSSPINAYTCGGESAVFPKTGYGDAITPIKAALQGMWTTMGSAK